MKLNLLYFILFLGLQLQAQVFDVETIKYTGDNDKRINLVILSEGYQSTEFDQFIIDATNFSNDIFSQSPYQEYSAYFNVYAIKVPSNESGADHPGTATDVTEPLTPITSVDTYFNATFDAYNFHRLLFYGVDGSTSGAAAVKINNVLADNFPMYDQVLLLVNTDIYGGSGGVHAMASTGASANEIAIHEIGHSLFNLRDEYYPGDGMLFETANSTQEDDTSIVKWKNWFGTAGVGLYVHGNSGEAATWYRPHQNCKMRYLNVPFCAVCKEAMVEKIHDLVEPIDAHVPNNKTVDNPTFPLSFELDLIKPTPNTLESTWTLNGNSIGNNVDDVSILETDLVNGINTLTITVEDVSPLLKVDNHETSSHVYTITWTINYSALGVEDIESTRNSFKITLSPNPATSFIDIMIDRSSNERIKGEILTLEGKKVKRFKLGNDGTSNINVNNLSQGIYLINFYTDNTLISSKKFAKL